MSLLPVFQHWYQTKFQTILACWKRIDVTYVLQPPICYDFARGACNRGARCKYRHVGEPGSLSSAGGGGGKMSRESAFAADRFDPYGGAG